MGLFIACILIYQFDMHWGFYVAAVAIGGLQLGVFDQIQIDVIKRLGQIREYQLYGAEADQ